MNTKTIALIVLRGLSNLFSAQSQPKISEALTLAAAAVEAGANVDAHLQTVADALNSDTPVDWDDIAARINSEVDSFLGGSEQQ